MPEYLILTSDGEVHSTTDYDAAVAVLDQYGPEVVDHNLGGPDGPQDTSLSTCSPLADLQL